MSDVDPLAYGGAFLVGGLFLQLIASPIRESIGVALGSWSWLFIIFGVAIIVVRLYTMAR